MTVVAQTNGSTPQVVDDRPTVHAAWNAVMCQVKGVGKRGRNTQQNYSFRGVDDVTNAAGVAFRRHGVFVIPTLVSAVYRDVKTTSGKAARECTVVYSYRVFGPRGDFFDGGTAGESLDAGDKGAPKAGSVAYRTFLIQALALSTNEKDPDSQSYERGTGPVSVEVDAANRDSQRPPREQLLEQVKTSGEELRSLREESEYSAADRVSKYCMNTLGVNVIKGQGPDGEVEELDLDRLSNQQLGLLFKVTKQSIVKARADSQEV